MSERENSESNYKGVETEQEDDYPQEPFDPRDIDITIEQKSLDSIVARIRHGEIDLDTEFQREGNLWSEAAMSRLIESVLVRFPLPAFYFDAGSDERWLVVDGLQRLSSFKRFMVDREKPLKLQGLEFLKDYEGKTFSELPRNMQRRLKESQITAYFIKPGTPEDVKYSVFYRINTGGLILNAQEIRHALNQDGDAAPYLKAISESPEFKRIVNISPRRMQDRELILRHLAFRMHPYTGYRPTMKSFLNDAMKELNKLSKGQLDELKGEFLSSLEASEELFGKNVFSRSLAHAGEKPVLNRGLFEVVTVFLAEMPEKEKGTLLRRKDEFLDEFKGLLTDETFAPSITSSTTGIRAVKERFSRIKELLTRYTQ